MADSYKFYLERAEAAAIAAGAATLDIVREQELRAEETWLGLAKKAKALALQREKADREKAERRASDI